MTAAQARGDWLTPPGDSAWDALRAARALAPRDPAVVAASRAMGMAARECFEQALRDNRLGEAGNCLDAWRQLDPDGSRRAEARHRLAQRWLAFGDERLQAGEVARAVRALEQARALEPSSPELDAFAARVERARQAVP